MSDNARVGQEYRGPFNELFQLVYLTRLEAVLCNDKDASLSIIWREDLGGPDYRLVVDPARIGAAE